MPKRLGWTDEEDKYLLENAPSMTMKQLRAGLTTVSMRACSKEALRAHCMRIGAEPISDGRHIWTDDEMTFLKENWGALNTDQIAQELGMSVSAVESKGNKLRSREGKLKRITPWMHTMLEKIGETGKSIYDVAYELWQIGRVVSVKEKDGMLAVFCVLRGPKDGVYQPNITWQQLISAATTA